MLGWMMLGGRPRSCQGVAWAGEEAIASFLSKNRFFLPKKKKKKSREINNCSIFLSL